MRRPFRLWVALLFLLIVLPIGSPKASGSSGFVRPLPAGDDGLLPAAGGTPAWQVERVDAPHRFDEMRDHSLALDADGHPHVAYGQDYLYYASYDGSSWSTEVVDDAGSVGQAAALALDAQGRPHISYYDSKNGDLKYASFDGTALRPAQGGAWHVETVDSTGQVGWDTSLALDAAGRPHISYFDSTFQDVKYAFYDGATWHIQVVDSAGQVGWDTSLALDAQGRPHISYYDWSGPVKYAFFDGTAWHVEIVDGGAALSPEARLPQPRGPAAPDSVNPFTSLALDGQGRPHISYCDMETHELKYALFDGIAWQIQVVDGAGGMAASLALDSQGRPRISYYSVTNLDLRYAVYDGTALRQAQGGAWQIEVVDSTGGEDTSLALDAQGRPHISYRNGGCEDYTLQHAFFDGTAWRVEVVDREGDAGQASSLALDENDRPHINYLGAAGLQYAAWDGMAWQIQGVDGNGGYSSLALDSLGRPHISYSDDVYGNLKYAFWDGGAWQTELVDGTGSVGGGSSLALDALGQPHISYFDLDSNDLKYARRVALSSPAQGPTWQIEVVDSAGELGWGTSLALDGQGRPHISYCLHDNYTCLLLKYAFFDGAAWQVQVVDSTGRPGQFSSLALDGQGRPHISYASASGLRYAAYDGTRWMTTTVDAAGGTYTSLALDAADRPHLSYYSDSTGSLHYAYYDGLRWWIEVVDGGSVGQFSSLALDGQGRPHISYYDEANGDLKYAYRQARFTVNRMFLPVVLKRQDRSQR